MVLQRVVVPKTKKGKKYLESREPKIQENEKTVMFIRGKNISEMINGIFKDLYSLKKTSAEMYHRKNDILPFENATTLEYFSKRSDASLFAFGSHTKKRPNNLVLGRLFNYEILDMIELGVLDYKSIRDFQAEKVALGTKPCLVFSGEAFDEDIEYQRLKSLFIDFFRGPVAKNIRLSGLEHVISFTAINGQIFLNSYRILMKKSGLRTPRVELEETGPYLQLQIRRTKLGSSDHYRRATKQPRPAKTKMRKNLSKDPFGTIEGRIHMERLDIDKLQTRKIKGLKRHLTPKGTPDESGEKRPRLDETDDNVDES